MATLQKFKFLATQCGVTQSPTRSPRTSPLVHLPRKKTTLRMLLTRNTSRSLDLDLDPKKNDTTTSHNKLKDLFVSSTTSFDDEENHHKIRGKTGKEILLFKNSGSPGWVGLRHRLLRKTWRPMLLAIPE